MKCVALLASPRKGGNCDILMDEMISSLKDYEVNKYYLDDLNIEPCHACAYCMEGNDCKVADDDGAAIIEDLLTADAIIFASPIYYGQMTAQGKLITDRFYSVSANPAKSFADKKCVLIFTQGAPEGTYDTYIELTKASPFGHTGMNVVDVLVAGGVNQLGEIKAFEDKLAKAREIGAKL